MQISIQGSTWEEVFKAFVTQLRGPRTAILSLNSDIHFYNPFWSPHAAFSLVVSNDYCFVCWWGRLFVAVFLSRFPRALFVKISPGFCQEAAKRGAISTNHRDRGIVWVILQVRVHDSAWEHATHPDWSNQTIYLQQIIIHDYQMKKKIILSTYFYILYHVKNALSDPKKPRKKNPFCHARSQQRTVAKSNETGAIGKVYLLLCWESHPEAR